MDGRKKEQEQETFFCKQVEISFWSRDSSMKTTCGERGVGGSSLMVRRGSGTSPGKSERRNHDLATGRVREPPLLIPLPGSDLFKNPFSRKKIDFFFLFLCCCRCCSRFNQTIFFFHKNIPWQKEENSPHYYICNWNFRIAVVCPLPVCFLVFCWNQVRHLLFLQDRSPHLGSLVRDYYLQIGIRDSNL